LYEDGKQRRWQDRNLWRRGHDPHRVVAPAKWSTGKMEDRKKETYFMLYIACFSYDGEYD
jgi:hypothetical protein